MKFNKTLILPIIAILLYYAGAGISQWLGYNAGKRDAFPTEWTCIRMHNIGTISSLDDKTILSYFPEDAVCARMLTEEQGQIGIMYGTGEIKALLQ